MAGVRRISDTSVDTFSYSSVGCFHCTLIGGLDANHRIILYLATSTAIFYKHEHLPLVSLSCGEYSKLRPPFQVPNLANLPSLCSRKVYSENTFNKRLEMREMLCYH